MNVNYKNILKKIKEVSTIDSDSVTFVHLVKSECPDCGYDPITGESTNPRCPTCGGTHVVTTEKHTIVTANVEYVSGLETVLDRGGKFEEGTVILTVHVDELEFHGLPTEMFDENSVDFFDVNNRRYTLEYVTPQYLHGYLYELIMRLKRYRG